LSFSFFVSIAFSVHHRLHYWIISYQSIHEFFFVDKRFEISDLSFIKTLLGLAEPAEVL